MKKLIIILFLFIISGCEGFTDVRINKAIQNEQIQLGSSKSEVVEIIGKPLIFCIKTKQTQDGYYEMWDFASGLCGNNFIKSYVFIFKDNILIEIRTIHDIRDLQW